MLGQSWLSPNNRRSSCGGTSHPRSFSVPFAGTFATPLSYRDVQELLVERGLGTDRTTVWRWVQHYAPELEERTQPHLKTTNESWRVDEVRIKGSWFTSIERSTQRERRFLPLGVSFCRCGQGIVCQGAGGSFSS
jgi:hypothetical protein